jgi:CheY-like chemotaxis protein
MGEHLPHIFEEYFQGPQNAQSSGFGLGLAIVQRLGNTLGHEIVVRSTPGKGSGFSIVVPLGREQLEGDGATALALNDFDSLFRRRMLIIEDEVSVRAALESWLRSEGLSVASVANGNDALALVTEKGMRFDLILSDYNLPGRMNGIDSIHALRAAVGWKIPAIVLTGDIRSGVIESIARHDFSVALKPVDTDQLMGLMKSQLAGSEARMGGSVLLN